MLVLTANTTLKADDGERYKLGPYLFETEQQRSDWKDCFDMLMADFYCEIRPAYSRMEPLLVYYEENVPILRALPAPPADYLVGVIRALWYDNQLDLKAQLTTAA